MQQLLFENVQNWRRSQTHTISLLVSPLLHAGNIFPGDELLMVKFCHFPSCYHAEIANFNIFLNVSHCSHFLIQGELPSLCYLSVTDLHFWPRPLALSLYDNHIQPHSSFLWYLLTSSLVIALVFSCKRFLYVFNEHLYGKLLKLYNLYIPLGF